MFNKTTRYIAFILALIIIIVWSLSFFNKRSNTRQATDLIKSSKDSIEFARINITIAQKRIDSMLHRMDSVKLVLSDLNKTVNKGQADYQTKLVKNMNDLEQIKSLVLKEQSEIDKLKEQLKQLK
jgi:hypothetical protein